MAEGFEGLSRPASDLLKIAVGMGGFPADTLARVYRAYPNAERITGPMVGRVLDRIREGRYGLMSDDPAETSAARHRVGTAEVRAIERIRRRAAREEV